MFEVRCFSGSIDSCPGLLIRVPSCKGSVSSPSVNPCFVRLIRLFLLPKRCPGLSLHETPFGRLNNI